MPEMREQSTEYKLTPAGQMVMGILNRQTSGYGREQLLLVALRLACKEVVSLEAGTEYHGRGEGDLLLNYLAMAEVFLKGGEDA